MKTIKHIDEVRCKICKGVYPDESDMIDGIWLNNDGKQMFIGYFCEFCRPPSAQLHPTRLAYEVKQMG